MKQLSDKFTSTYKETISESNVNTNELQKILKLFGYDNSFNNRYIKQCDNKSTIIDIHKFESLLSESFAYIMLIESDNSRQSTKTGILYKVKKSIYPSISNKNFTNVNTLEEIHNRICSIDPSIEIVIKYE